jgi:hypothetical protein
MRRLIPSRVEMIIFAVLAMACALAVAFFRPAEHDLGFAAMAGPIFLVAACMGLRRSPIWTAQEAADEEID